MNHIAKALGKAKESNNDAKKKFVSHELTKALRGDFKRK